MPLLSLATQEGHVSFMDVYPILLFYILKTIYSRKVQFILVLLVQSLT